MMNKNKKVKYEVIKVKTVEIFLDELYEIENILHKNLVGKKYKIESRNYIYDNFDELSHSPEEYIYNLKIKYVGKKEFLIEFTDYVTIKYNSDNLKLDGTAKLIKDFLSNAKFKRRSLLIYINLYRVLYFSIFSILSLSIGFVMRYLNYYSLIYVSPIIAIFLFILFSSPKYENIINIGEKFYSKIILYKREFYFNIIGIRKYTFFKSIKSFFNGSLYQLLLILYVVIQIIQIIFIIVRK